MAREKRYSLEILDSTEGKLLAQTIQSERMARNEEVTVAAKTICDRIREEGDAALIDYTARFDKIQLTPETLRLSTGSIEEAARKADPRLQETIREAAQRIRAYHQKQGQKGFSMQIGEGTLSQLIRPLDRVGVYVPGGYTAYPSSVLMTVIPAQIAGVKEIVAVTPAHGRINPGVAFALSYLQIGEIYQIGGAQAVAALAYGTDTIRPVAKIVGPGNAYVAAAKKLMYGQVDIDSVAGPSEVAILADDSIDPSWVALDLLSQAEHGSGDEIAVCVTEDEQFAHKIARALQEEIVASPVREVLEKLPAHAISIFVAQSRQRSIEFINWFAPEHLQIITKSWEADLEGIRNAAAVFIGAFTPVALGDYFVGTNHVLPTGSGARYASPLGVESYMKRMSVAHISAEGLQQVAPHVSRFARSENFVHHAMSVERRLENR